MSLNVKDWKSFKTSDLFYNMQNGKANQQMLEDGDECFYVGAKKDDNGVMIHCAKDESLITKGNCIIFICNGQGSVGYANYMDVDFIGTTDIVAGYNDHLNEYTGAFLATIYSQERPKYSFGRKWKTHLSETEVKLPADSEGNPDWKFMEDYIKSLHHKPLTTKNKKGQAPDLNVQTWKEFRLGDYITDIYKAKAINKDDLTVASDPQYHIHYITRTGENNGCEMIADTRDIDNDIIEKGNAITIGDTTATCFYQEEEFITGDHMVIVRANTWLNKYTALYIIAILNNEQYKYSYGRAFLMDRIKDTMVKLPADSEGNPDWQFMEDYIKSLPYGDRL